MPIRSVPAPAGGDLQGIALHGLVSSSPRLSTTLAEIAALGASPAGAVYDRQNLGAVGARIVLGPPGRREFNAVPQPSLPVMNLASTGYLALGADPRVTQGAASAMERHGTHTGGARLLCGTTGLHCALEERLGAFLGADSVVTYSSGWGTNVSVIAALFGPGDLIILDRHAHRSIYDGATLSRAAIKRFAHNDLGHLDHVLRRTASVRRRLVAVDSVYSMEGALAPLPDLLALVRRHGAFLLTDEAHAFGVVGSTGRGATEHFGIDPAEIDIRVATLSKAIPAVGGFAAVHATVGAVLRYASSARVFSAALTPPDVGAALAGLEILEREPARVVRLQRNAAGFRSALVRHGLDTFGSETAIVPVRVGERARTLAAAAALLDRGVYVNAIIPPGVRPGEERLRCFVNASHTEADLEYAAAAIAEVLGATAAAG